MVPRQRFNELKPNSAGNSVELTENKALREMPGLREGTVLETRRR
jgi:hypothetical protein